MKGDRRQGSFEKSLHSLQVAFRRRRAARGFVRAAWMALLVPTALMAGQQWLGWQVGWRYWGFIALAVAALMVLWSLRPVSGHHLVAGLDRRFGLRSRLQTAYEVGDSLHIVKHDNPVVRRLIEEASGITASLRKRVRAINLGFWLEVQTLIGVTSLLVALLLLDALNVFVPSASPADFPPAWREPIADEVLPPNATLFPPPGAIPVQIPVANAQQLQQGLEALADALRDMAATRAIAEAIDRGDWDGAAQALRRLADQLGSLSSDARDALGDALGEAAENIPDEARALNDPLRDGSEALANGDLDAAEQALEDLAAAVESMDNVTGQVAQAPGEGPPAADSSDPTQDGDQAEVESGTSEESSGAGAGEGEGAGGEEPSALERLAVEGQPLELDSDSSEDDRIPQPAEPGAQVDSEDVDSTPFSRRSLGFSIADLGPDPLSYPWDKRDIIRRYFTP